MCGILEKAYAKVNFGLKVCPKLPASEFHNIESIFQTIDLFDELVIEVVNSGSDDTNHCFVYCDSIILPEKNTLTNAYDAFCEIISTDVPSVKVTLKKGIPVGGGLGGGSADAAALIRGLEKLCCIKLTDEQRIFIASKTGSDVFFFMDCLEGHGCALVSGRGENIRKIKSRNDLLLLMVFPKEGSSTKEAYALVDELIANGREPKSPLFENYEEIYNKPVEEWTFVNTFTPAIRTFIPSVDIAMNELNKNGALYTEMSGSGSTVYAIYKDMQQTEKSYELLKNSFDCQIVHVI